MRGGPRSWWGRRGIRSRLVLSTVLPLTLALVIATVAVAFVFSAGRVRELDGQTRVSADSLVGLVSSGQLPAVLPLPAGSTLLAQVLGADGSVLSSSASASRVVALVHGPVTSRRAVETDEEGSYAGAPLRIRVRASELDGRPVQVVVAAPLTDVRRALRALRLVLLVVVPLLIATTAWLVHVVAGRALRPVERLRAAAEQLAARPGQDPDAQLPVPPGTDEVARLASTLNGLLGALNGLVSQQRSFIADAAHELRSPLSALRVQLEVAQQHPGHVVLPELLDDLEHDLARLLRLTDDLLALARVESGQHDQQGLVDLTGLGAEGAQVRVLGDEQALQRMLDNLVSNARRHASTVRVSVAVDRDVAVLDVDDDGPGIPVPDRERVFDRWVRLDEARVSSGGGAGLGLALAREIARRHGGDISVEDSPLGGARLQVRLPLHR